MSKTGCGSIHFKNNIIVSINESTFHNNRCENNGGAMYGNIKIL